MTSVSAPAVPQSGPTGAGSDVVDPVGLVSTPNRSRRPSWISSISAKLSAVPSSDQQAALSASPSTVSAGGTIRPPRDSALNDLVAVTRPGSAPASSANPASLGGLSFFSAIRRLSSSRSSNQQCVNTKAPVPLVPRRILNVNTTRARCAEPSLGNAGKLRRVAFCIDVSIASPPTWPDGDPQPLSREEQDGRKLDEVPEKDETASQPGLSTGASAAPDQAAGSLCQCAVPTSTSSLSSKKWRRTTSAGGRCKGCDVTASPTKANGTDPPGTPLQPARAATPPPTTRTRGPNEVNTRATTDPLRIYRRCCQLRESPVLKRIADQLTALRTQLSPSVARERGKPIAINAATIPTVPLLDLTNSCLQDADFNTLADFLALVPVKRLILDNADIGDTPLRAVLSGLLQVRTSGSRSGNMEGVIESLNLSRNRRLTVAGWRHISLFLYLCESVKVVDLSFIPFPFQFGQKEPAYSPDLLKRTETHPHALPHLPYPHAHLHLRSPFHLGSKQSASSDTIPLHPSLSADVFSRALHSRRARSTLEEVRLGNCRLSASALSRIVDAAIVCGVNRLSLAGNSLDKDGFDAVMRYAKSGVCQGLDLGSNNLHDLVDVFADCCADMADQMKTNPLWAICLADCGLDGRDLQKLLPQLAKLPNLRFLDLSHNQSLLAGPAESASSGSQIGLVALRKWIPRCAALRRLHLADVALTPVQAISVAEIIPDTPILGLVDIMDNPAIMALADASAESDQEDAYALYASFAAAARASRSILRIDMPLPSGHNGEVVKALARQLAASCLRNVGRWTEAVVEGDPLSHVARLKRHQRHRQRQRRAAKKSQTTDTADQMIEQEKQTISESAVGPSFALGRYSEAGPAIPPRSPSVYFDSLDAGSTDENDSDKESGDGESSDSDYSDASFEADNLAIRAPGVAKALHYYLSDECRLLTGDEGDEAPRTANEMTKHLLGSARRIRARLQTALKRAADDPEQLAGMCRHPVADGRRDSSDAGAEVAGLPVADFVFRRLQFLDSTLEQMIERFESEFPDCKQVSRDRETKSAGTGTDVATKNSLSDGARPASGGEPTELVAANEDDDPLGMTALRSRQNQSDVSLASRALVSEEARVHRMVRSQENSRPLDGLALPAHLIDIGVTGPASAITLATTDESGTDDDVEDFDCLSMRKTSTVESDPGSWRPESANGHV